MIYYQTIYVTIEVTTNYINEVNNFQGNPNRKNYNSLNSDINK